MRRILVTAGNTREMIDRVRDWGNIFTGKTGLAIAKSLAVRGHVDLVTSNQAHLAELSSSSGLTGHPFKSHADLRNVCEKLVTSTHYDAIFMTAAVADYSPSGAYNIQERAILADGREMWTVQPIDRPKIKSTHRHVAFTGKQTEKIVDLFRGVWNFKGLLVKFKLEVAISPEHLLVVAEKSRVSSGAQYLVANTLDMVEGASAGAFLLSDAGHHWVPRAELAHRLSLLV